MTTEQLNSEQIRSIKNFLKVAQFTVFESRMEAAFLDEKIREDLDKLYMEILNLTVRLK